MTTQDQLSCAAMLCCTAGSRTLAFKHNTSALHVVRMAAQGRTIPAWKDRQRLT
jgi:hypothetical protein